MALTGTAVLNGTIPIITGLPTITANPPVTGETATATAAPVTAAPSSTRTWQWERDGTPIGGATGSTYEFVIADEGALITVVQTETNLFGSTSAESTPTAVIAPPPDPGDITGNIAILNSQAGGAAPGVWVFAVDVDSLTGISQSAPVAPAVRDERLHQLDFVWSFDDPGTFNNADMCQTRHQDSNFADTPKAAHAFLTGGTYTVTCTVTDPATDATGILTIEVTVGDEDDLYPGSQTIVVDPGATGIAASYPGCQSMTIQNAINYVRNTAPATSPTRIILANGVTHSPTNTTMGSSTNQCPTFFIRAHDVNGTKPVLYRAASVILNDLNGIPNRNVLFQGIEFDSDYDPPTRTPQGVTPAVNLQAAPNSPQQVALIGCNIRQHQMLFQMNGGTTVTHRIHVWDCDFQGWDYYAIFGSAEIVTITGSKIHQDPASWYGDPRDENIYGCGRYPAVDNLLFHASSFHCRLTIDRRNPCLRFFPAEEAVGCYASMSGCWAEGGTQIVSSGVEAGDLAHAANMIFQCNYFMGSFETNAMANVSRGGQTWRSNIFNFPNVVQPKETFDNFINISTEDVPVGELDEGIVFHGNTFIANGKAATANNGFDGFTNVAFENNARHTSTFTSDGPFTETAYRTPLELGENLTSGSASRTAGTATPTDEGFLPYPNAGAGALSGVVGTVAAFNLPYRNFLGDLHTEDYRGALPPA